MMISVNLILLPCLLFQPAKPATFLNSESVICHMDTPRTANITVSYGGERASEAVLYVVYDSFCQACDEQTLVCVERVKFTRQVQNTASI